MRLSVVLRPPDARFEPPGATASPQGVRGVLLGGQQLAATVSTARPPDRTGGALGWLAEVSWSPIVRPGGLK